MSDILVRDLLCLVAFQAITGLIVSRHSTEVCRGACIKGASRVREMKREDSRQMKETSGSQLAQRRQHARGRITLPRGLKSFLANATEFLAGDNVLAPARLTVRD
jgi:hypothetical protein